ncbi:transcriptional regulator [Flavobacterium beibuense F44-8]|uniref:Aminopyrimidine aminohydrolase n=1 Tax=Flavobacterium beibuense F44-8 TaxID=1406840 RepID=A0A0A2LH59_9FLAO|nr:thiaminase II [Flavobacterium beibuense]KGO79224.1 transcriptional regulator [Flavobacterium beibuense F44-8]
MKWSEKAWQEILPIYNDIIQMPFITELANGTLDLEKFKYYMQQDAHYLEYFARTLAVISAKAQSVNTMLDFIRFSEGAIVVERALHDSYFKQFNVGDRVPMSPTCHHYVHYMQSTVYMQQVEVGMAAVLPCFWIYKKVGDYILEIQTKGNNPYADWINTYGGEEFGQLVEKAITLCDEAANSCTEAQRKQMIAAFVDASRLEYLFWDSAYQLEKWKK